MIEIALQDVEIDFGFKKILKGVSFVVKTGLMTMRKTAVLLAAIEATFFLW